MLSISPPVAMGKSPAEDTPMLSLTHFSRPPFLSFGCVRVGSGRSCQLLVHNPNQEPAYVVVNKLPEHRGFSVSETELSIQPSESITLTITWTPLEEGGVRELVTFIVNDVVKHQAVLLGRAELPTKKKGNLRNATKKKSVPAAQKVLGPRKKDLGIHKPTSMGQKNVYGKPERARSPLYSCENLPLNSASPLRDKPQSRENRMQSLNISPLAQDFTPGSLRRSKTYSVLCSTEYETLEEVTTTSRIQTDIRVDEEWTFSYQGPRKSSVSPITSQIGQPLNVTCTPTIVRLSPSYSGLSPTEFYNHEHVETGVLKQSHHLEVTDSFKDPSQEDVTVTSCSTRSPTTLYFTPQKNILSPDSFVNNSHVPDDPCDDPSIPILSPDQFVRENCVTLVSESSLESVLTNSWQQTSVASSKDSVSSVAQKQVKTWQVVSRHVDLDFSSHVLKEPELISSRLTYCVKKKQKGLIPVDETCNNEPKKPPVLSATVVKAKANDCKDNSSRPKLKSRRRLENIELENEKKTPPCIFQDLPVITISNPPEKTEPAKEFAVKTISGRKRKSEDFTRTFDVKGYSTESTLNTCTPVKKSHVSKLGMQQAGKQGNASQRKRAVTLAVKSSAKVQESLKPKAALVKTAKTEFAGPPTLPHATTFKKSKLVVGVAQSRLNFIKPSKTVIPRHPMPFAAKNMFYDERWMAKQERGFTWWLNFILTPDDFAMNTNSVKVNAAALILGEENIHKASVPKAPTKEEVSLKAYTARCRLNRLRRTACRLFTSEPIVRAVRRLEVEIEARRLLVRKDRHLWKDIGERQKILNWLLSYTPLWLRVGLETTFGELISLESNSDITGLAVFILNRLLWNPDIAAEYRHPSVPHLYRDGHEEALSKFTLKKLLLLVFFLDHAKQSRLIDHDPCLFWKDAEFKASKDLLLAFSRDFLSGEGDLSRHLSYLGLPVSHVQTPLDEFDFAVTNLAVDLQCGIRLVRTMELLTQNWSLSKKLRVPAISRLQKMHNVEVALHVLTEKGIEIKDERGVAITSKDIVDRHRERTLALLWSIVFTFQVDVLLSVEILKEEIRFLKRSYNTQKMLAALRSFTTPGTVNKRESDSFVNENYSERVLLLMEWVNATCAFYNAKVENFTVSFSDGRVFCYLINHYHTSYLPLNAICQRTTQTVECTETGTVGLNSSSDSDSMDGWPGMTDQGITTSALYKELLENERTNYSLIHSAVSKLGGIPAMIHHSDMSNTIPDEKVVIAFLSFLCARLLDLRKETRAARVIQTAWRKYKLKIEELHLERKHKAARVITRTMVRFLERRRLKKILAAVVIQKYWRRRLALKELNRLKAHRLMEAQAIIIQRYWKGYLARKSYRAVRYYVVVLQARARTKIAVSSYNSVRCAAVTIQTYLRSWLLMKTDRQKYLQLRSAALIIQTAFRRWRRKKLKRATEAAVLLQRVYRKWQARKLSERNAAVTIQAMYRMHRERQKYLDVKCKIVQIQSWFRCKRTMRSFLTTRKQVLTLQRYYRAYKQGRTERERYLLTRSAAISIQRWYRNQKSIRNETETSLKTERAVIFLQAAYRGWKVRKQMQKHRDAAICIQSAFKRLVAQRKFTVQKKAAVTLQRCYRAVLAGRRERQKYLRLCRVVRNMQALWRCRALMRSHRRHQAAVLIQSFYRMRVQCAKYNAMKQACTIIQSRYRAYKEGTSQRSRYLSMKTACTVLQAAYRGWKVRKDVSSLHRAACIIQASYRTYRLWTRYVAMRTAAVTIQRRYRTVTLGRLQNTKYLLLKRATITVQSYYRGMIVRRKIVEMRRSAVTIQSLFRMHRMRVEYQETRLAAISIQRRCRALWTGREVRKNYLRLRKAACVLQAAWRGRKVREHVKGMHKAAVLIQSWYRMLTQRRYYKALKKATEAMQQLHRASKERTFQANQYRRIRDAAIRIQAAFRGMKARRDIQGKHEAAALIQRVYKGYLERHRYLVLRSSVILIQQRYRRKLCANQQRLDYISLKKAAVVVQAGYRGLVARREIRHMHVSAMVIQAAFRKHIAYVSYRKMKCASVTIQRWYRTTMDQRKRRDAAVIIQAAYRGARDRQRLNRMNQAASKIQNYFRMSRCVKRYNKLRQAALAVQQRYRANKLRDFEVMRYVFMKDAALCIQAACRAWRVRREMKRINEAAVVIQRRFRALVESKRYRSVKAAALVIQRWYRATVLMRELRKDFHALRMAAICIQATYRGVKVRNHLALKHKMARKIQIAYRIHRARVSYQAMQSAAGTIQAWYRSIKISRIMRSAYVELRHSTILIQAAYRGSLVRKSVRSMHMAATTIQSYYRMHSQRNRYKHMVQAARTIQQRFRDTKARNLALRRYQETRRATLLLQAAFRGMKVRKEIQKAQQSAVVIQRCFRSYIQRQKYLALQVSAVCIQRRYRALLLGRSTRRDFIACREAAVCIQAAYRGFKERRELARMHKAACKIQSVFRMHRMYAKYQTMKLAATLIQRRYRSLLIARCQRAQYLRIRMAAIVVQAAYRGMQTRRNLRELHKAAVKIQARYRMHSTFRAKKAAQEAKRNSAAQVLQAAWKMHRTRRDFVKVKAAALLIQAAFRGQKSRRQHGEMQAAACLIQHWYRSRRVARLQRARYLSVRTSAVIIQAAFRRKLAHRLQQKETAARKLQAFLRMTVCRKRFLRLKSAAIQVQSFYRMQKSRRAYVAKKTAALAVQRRYRAHLAMKRQRETFVKMRRSVVCIQSAVRGFRERQNLQRLDHCAVKIQALWRSYSQRQLFLRYKSSAVIIQQRYRAWRLQKIQRQCYLRLKLAVTNLQTLYRGYQARRLIQRERAARVIQAAYRCYTIRRDYIVLTKAAKTIQRCVRAKRERSRFLRIREAAVCIQRRWRETVVANNLRKAFLQKQAAALRLQSAFRGYIVRREMLKILRLRRETVRLRFTSAVYLHLCAVKIQRRFRVHLALKKAQKQINHVICIQRWYRSRQERKHFLVIRQKVITVQRAARAWFNRRNEAACKIQRCVRDYFLRKKRNRVINGIVRFQALWRGYTWRKTHNTKALNALRNRLQKVNQEIKEEDKLYHRTSVAVEYLLTYKHLSFILAALQHLEVATRLSSLCCENMARSGAVKAIFILIRSCNRSIPCMEVIRLSVQVLLNLSKYEGTVQVVYEVEKSVDILLDLMQMYREKAGDKVSEKGGSIFTKTCCLLAIFALNSQRAHEIRAAPKAVDRIRSIYKLTCRKHKMDNERNLTRQRLSNSVLGNVSIQATPIRTRVVSRIKPDWVLRKDNMREIVDPLKAIRMVLDTLGIAV
ncbi:abnormal spindle-like microcephaly-associated protein isoform X2 [Spea bombifrons]|uniref:abnormal spindle-like microcephaly-associated protein isoform X2 n=1 Tax=Spea bombifrons TaxID=233779 RepID=UPI00234B7037|nr:abnormal spindle-like microcephaly-associated protein isoform X2 [Spea bombifrons]